MNKSEIDEVSLYVLKSQLPPSVTWTLLGFLAGFLNCLLFYVVLSNKKFRSNFYLCLLHLAASDLLFGFANAAVGLKRLILVGMNTPETTSPLNCCWLLFWIFLFKTTSPAQAVAIGIDRVMCVAFPTKYRDFEVKHLQLINVVLWVVPGAIVIYYGTILNTDPLIASCDGGLVFQYLPYISASMGIGIEVVTIALYGGLLLMLGFRLHKGKKKGQDMKELKKSIQFGAIKTSFMLLVVYTCIAFSAELYLIGTMSFDDVTKVKIQPYCSTILLIACNLTTVISVVRNKDIFHAVKTLMFCGKNSVEPIGSTRGSKTAAASTQLF